MIQFTVYVNSYKTDKNNKLTMIDTTDIETYDSYEECAAFIDSIQYQTERDNLNCEVERKHKGWLKVKSWYLETTYYESYGIKQTEKVGQ